MNDKTEWHISPLQDHPPAVEAVADSGGTREDSGRVMTNRAPQTKLPGNGEVPAAAFDAWSWLELLAQHWGSLLLCGIATAVAGAGAGLAIWKTQYVAQAQLI